MSHLTRRPNGQSAVTLDENETWQLVTVRACERLHLTPDQWRAISYEDQCWFLEVWRADEEIASDRRRNPKALRNRL